MSYYYGYYDYYGSEDFSEYLDDYLDFYYDEYYGDVVEAEESSPLIGPKLLWGLSILAEFGGALYSPTTTDEWDLAGYSMYSNSGTRLTNIIAAMFIPFVDKLWKPLVAVTLVNSLVSIYLINDADSASDDSKSTVLYAINAFGIVTSVMAILGDNPFTDSDSDDYYYYSGYYYSDYYYSDYYYSDYYSDYGYYGYYY